MGKEPHVQKRQGGFWCARFSRAVNGLCLCSFSWCLSKPHKRHSGRPRKVDLKCSLRSLRKTHLRGSLSRLFKVESPQINTLLAGPLLVRVVGHQRRAGDQIEHSKPGKSPGCGKASGGPSATAGEAGKKVTKAGLLNRVIDDRPLRGAGEGFKLRDVVGVPGLDKLP
jgi:hypothetical protein